MPKPRLGSIYRRRKRTPDGSLVELPTLWIKYRRNGQVFRESSGSDRETVARNLIKKRTAEIVSGTFGGPCIERIKIGELLDDLLLDYQVNGRAYNDFAEPIVRLHLRPVFCLRRASELTTPEVQAYMTERRRAGAANATINRECALLKRALNLGRMQTPPKVVRVPYIPRLKEDNVRTGFLEYEEFVLLRSCLPAYLRPVLTFGYYTGCRRGEILSLRWPQVDLNRRVVRLEAGTTKNDDARLLPLAAELYEVLAMQRSIRDTECPTCPWVFNRHGKPILDFRGTWKDACRAAGLWEGDYKTGKPTRLFHDLRRSGVRNLVRAGVPESVSMRISGHRSRSVFERYNIVSERDLQEAARRLGEFINERKAAASFGVGVGIPIEKTDAGANGAHLGTLAGTPRENPTSLEAVADAKLVQ